MASPKQTPYHKSLAWYIGEMLMRHDDDLQFRTTAVAGDCFKTDVIVTYENVSTVESLEAIVMNPTMAAVQTELTKRYTYTITYNAGKSGWLARLAARHEVAHVLCHEMLTARDLCGGLYVLTAISPKFMPWPWRRLLLWWHWGWPWKWLRRICGFSPAVTHKKTDKYCEYGYTYAAVELFCDWYAICGFKKKEDDNATTE